MSGSLYVYEARDLRRKRIRFAKARTEERPSQYTLQVGWRVISLESLTDTALADLCSVMVRDFWAEKRLNRLNREKRERPTIIQEPTEPPWWAKPMEDAAAA